MRYYAGVVFDLSTLRKTSDVIKLISRKLSGRFYMEEVLKIDSKISCTEAKEYFL